MKAMIVFIYILLLSNTTMAEKNEFKLMCDTANSPPARSALFTLSRNGYLEQSEVAKFMNDAANERKNENITLKIIGLKKIGPIPWYEEFVPPQGPMPFDTPIPGDDLYQMVQVMKIKNATGKVFEFVVVGNVADSDCEISMALVIETSPQYRVVGKWEDYLQAWERLKRKEKDISPNLVK